jgi:hypothetical protein
MSGASLIVVTRLTPCPMEGYIARVSDLLERLESLRLPAPKDT